MHTDGHVQRKKSVNTKQLEQVVTFSCTNLDTARSIQKSSVPKQVKSVWHSGPVGLSGLTVGASSHTAVSECSHGNFGCTKMEIPIPVSLLGREKQLPCTDCTPDGLFLTVPNNKTLQAVQHLQSASDFRFCWAFPGCKPADTFTVANVEYC